MPPYLRVVAASACSKGLNSLAAAAGAMPMPVSRTANFEHDARRRCARRWRTETTTSPLLGELDRVADEVHDHLAQAVDVADQRIGHVRVRRRTPAPAPCCWRAAPAG